jgi:hypothetical protein
MTTLTVKAKDFRPGDLLSSGSTVVGGFGFVKGGYKVFVRKPDGTEAAVVFSGRRRFEVTREATP